MQRSHGYVLTLSLWLSGCQSLPTTPIHVEEPASGTARRTALEKVQAFEVEAKLAVQYAGKGYTARMQWQHSATQDTLDIFSPLGQQVAHIERDHQQVRLTDQRGTLHQAQDIAALTEQLLGWRLPLSGLSQWILGIPAPNSPYQAQYLASGEPLQLQQEGWRIDYGQYQSGALPTNAPQTLPNYLYLQQQDIRLKLVILQWQIPH